MFTYREGNLYIQEREIIRQIDGPHAPRGQEALSPGQHPGYMGAKETTPCKGKSMKGCAFAPTGRIRPMNPYPGRCPGLNAPCPYRAQTPHEFGPRALPWAKCPLPLRGAIYNGIKGKSLLTGAVSAHKRQIRENSLAKRLTCRIFFVSLHTKRVVGLAC